MNIYELNVAYSNLVDALENCEVEEAKEVIAAAMEEVHENRGEKVDNLIKYIRNLEGTVKGLKEEEKCLADKRKAIEKKVEQLSMYLYDVTRTTEGQKIQGKIFTTSIKKNPPKMIVENEDIIPEEFWKENISIDLDKKAIKDALKNGVVVDGCVLVQDTSLKIK